MTTYKDAIRALKIAFDDTVYWPVNEAVYWAVDGAVWGAVNWAVDGAVGRAVNRVVLGVPLTALYKEAPGSRLTK
jgi:hypothetical protein